MRFAWDLELLTAKGKKAVHVQDHFYQQAKKDAKAREHERSKTVEPHVPAE